MPMNDIARKESFWLLLLFPVIIIIWSPCWRLERLVAESKRLFMNEFEWMQNIPGDKAMREHFHVSLLPITFFRSQINGAQFSCSFFSLPKHCSTFYFLSWLVSSNCHFQRYNQPLNEKIWETDANDIVESLAAQ